MPTPPPPKTPQELSPTPDNRPRSVGAVSASPYGKPNVNPLLSSSQGLREEVPGADEKHELFKAQFMHLDESNSG